MAEPIIPEERSERHADRQPRSITCGCCDSVLARDGGVMRLGDRGRTLAKLEARVDELDATIAGLRAEKAALETKVRDLESASQPEGSDDDAESGDDWLSM